MKVYVLLLWNFNESQVIGVCQSLNGAKELAFSTSQQERDAHGWQYEVALMWAAGSPDTPDHRDSLWWARAPQHDSYDIYEMELLP